MARRRRPTKRFKSYERALQIIKDPDAPADADLTLDKQSPLYLYFTRKTRNITYTRSTDSKPKKILEVSIKPFGAAADATNLAIVSFSQRVKEENAVKDIITACNHNEVDISFHSPRVGFKPAKATIFIPAATQSTTKEPSKITGVLYNPREGSSYTIPYGQKTGAIYESLVRENIQTAVNAITTATVSFKSEVY